MQYAIALFRKILQRSRHRWDCFRGRHEMVEVDRYIGHDIGMNKDHCRHCDATDEWLS